MIHALPLILGEPQSATLDGTIWTDAHAEASAPSVSVGAQIEGEIVASPLATGEISQPGHTDLDGDIVASPLAYAHLYSQGEATRGLLLGGIFTDANAAGNLSPAPRGARLDGGVWTDSHVEALLIIPADPAELIGEIVCSPIAYGHAVLAQPSGGGPGSETLRVPESRTLHARESSAWTTIWQKSPDDEVSFALDWSAVLGDDEIDSSTWTASGVTIDQTDYTDRSTSIKISGGDPGRTYRLKNEISTARGAVRTLIVPVYVGVPTWIH